MRHICAACVPANVKFFKYDWKKEAWNLYFVAGLFLGALLVTLFFLNLSPISIHPSLAEELAQYGIMDLSNLAEATFLVGKCAHAQRIFDDDSRRILSRLRCTLCRRMHQRARNHGAFYAPTALAHCDHQLYGRRFLDGKLHSAFDS